VLDTGSSDLWFATAGCTSCNAATPLLDTAKSSSLQPTTQNVPLSYGSGNANGTLVRDTVSMSVFTVPQQQFGEQLI
jgi:cathepsin D